MKQLYTALALLTSNTLLAQDCSTGRYVAANLFPNVTVTSAVVYGSNTGVSGGTQTLRMDVYQPTGDLMQDRPVVIVAFGGSFISGSRTDAGVVSVCQDLAKRGYVAVAPDYRVGFFFPNEATTTRAVMRGAHDMKAVVRYLRKSVAELGNPYNIDPERIITGGISAGAISAIHATYLNEEDEIPPVLVPEMPALGGVEGNSGSSSYSSVPFACYSFSGAIGDTLWMLPGDVPLASIHEVGDGVVPYYTQEVAVVGVPTGLIASGSHDIHIRANDVGMVNCFRSYPGSGHVGYLSTDFATAMNWTAQFLGQLSCGTTVTCGDVTAGMVASTSNAFSITPNPTTGDVRLQLPEAAQVELFDASGRSVMLDRFGAGTARMDLGALPAGIYVAHVTGTIVGTFRIVRAD